MKTGGMGIAGEGMKDKDGVRSVSIQFAIGLIGNGDGPEFFTVLQGKFIGGKGKLIMEFVSPCPTLPLVS